MGFFHLHRTSSSASSRSASSAYSAQSYGTPRTSTDSANDYMIATLKPQFITPRAPLLNLPFEILQQIASYLDDVSASRFSLSGRQICYAVGTKRLSAYITSSPSRFDARERLENTIERALPGAWHCAWCDKFHPWSSADTPSAPNPSHQNPCADYNSYLSDATGYTLRYHHIRLALAAHTHGPHHGLPLTAFTHQSSSSIPLFRTPIQTSIAHSARITNNRFLLHTTLSLLLPTWTTTHKSLITHLWPLLPPMLTQHRATEFGHTGLMAALDNVARRGWRVAGAQACADCDSEWSITAYAVPKSVVGEFVRLEVKVWRDLGRGESPFEAGWRMHGMYLAGSGGSVVRGEDGGREMEIGGVRERFEKERGGEMDDGEGGAWEALAYSWQLERKREDERCREREWRAIWKYLERRAGVASGGVE